MAKLVAPQHARDLCAF